MINTQKVTNHVSDKLKLIELGSLDDFIDTYLKQTITFVAKCVKEQKEYLISILLQPIFCSRPKLTLTIF